MSGRDASCGTCRCPGWFFWAIAILYLSISISLAGIRVARAINRSADMQFCMEAAKVLPKLPELCGGEHQPHTPKDKS